VLALVYGVLTALCWGTSAVTGARVGSRIGSFPATFAMSAVGLAVVIAPALAVGPPAASTGQWLLAFGAGLAYLTGSACWMLGVQRGSVGIVTTLVSTDGAIAAVIAVLLGETLTPGAGGALAVIAVGVLLSTRHGGGRERVTAPAVAFGLAGALCFGLVFVLGGHAGDVGTLWVLLASRATAVALLTPFILRTPIPARRLWPWILFTGATDVGGYAFFLLGSQASIAIASVLASQYALVAVLTGRIAFGERLSRTQAIGVCCTLAGVVLLAVIQA
jgi:drug/metabolite transporter (DMT)-like permease